jgi:hypothetical protein
LSTVSLGVVHRPSLATPATVAPRAVQLREPTEGHAQRYCAWHLDPASFYDMATTVLRVRLIGGDRMDITYDKPDIADEDELVEHVISVLAQDSGVLRTKHGDRLVVLYGRGVAGVEVAPRGAVL